MKRIGRKTGNENPSSQSHWLGFKSAGNVYNSGLQTEHSWHIWGSSALPFKKLKWRNTTNVNLGLKGPPFWYGSVINREKKWFLLFFQRKLFQSKHTCCFTDIYFKRFFLAFPSRYGWLLLRWTSPPWQRVLCTKPFPSHRRSTHSSWAARPVTAGRGPRSAGSPASQHGAARPAGGGGPYPCGSRRATRRRRPAGWPGSRPCPRRCRPPAGTSAGSRRLSPGCPPGSSSAPAQLSRPIPGPGAVRARRRATVREGSGMPGARGERCGPVTEAAPCPAPVSAAGDVGGARHERRCSSFPTDGAGLLSRLEKAKGRLSRAPVPSRSSTCPHLTASPRRPSARRRGALTGRRAPPAGRAIGPLLPGRAPSAFIGARQS